MPNAASDSLSFVGEIDFFQEQTNFEIESPMQTRVWLSKIAASYRATIKTLNYIFCSDEYLYEMNLQYLGHDTLTDIITFDNSEKEATEIVNTTELIDINKVKIEQDDFAAIEGDIFVSVERVRENAADFGVSFETELRRVMAHGLLHLLGYDDHSEEEEAEMRAEEDFCLSLWQ
ncbi:rRNA maturation RNase YbeY [Hugenholtzia roseola]|uniref:rRNA maturation RNase YbeY n=1 Tax=Hugenholtzia roseola TaxID=1002 RepID=UPI0003FA0E1D|nr:rRNA maturation RNase YbeY [Hugenholtzia roseola]